MIVLDCSAAMEMALGTEEGLCLRDLFLPEERCIAPSFLQVELANVIWKHVLKGYVDEGNMSPLFACAVSLVDEYYPDEDLLEESLREGRRMDHSVYDLLYLILARRTGATLFTCDKKLQTLCRSQGIDCITTVNV